MVKRRKNKIISKVKKKSRRKRKTLAREFEISANSLREIWSVIFFGFAVVIIFAILGKAGGFGIELRVFAENFFGKGIYFLPILFFLTSVTLLFRNINLTFVRIFGLVLFLVSSLGFIHTFSGDDIMSMGNGNNEQNYGGWIGFFASVFFVHFFGEVFSSVFFICLILISFILSFDISIKLLFSKIAVFLIGFIKSKFSAVEVFETKKKRRFAGGDVPVITKIPKSKSDDEMKINSPFLKTSTISGLVKSELEKKSNVSKKFASDNFVKVVQKKKEKSFVKKNVRIGDNNWIVPKLDLLDESSDVATVTKMDLEKDADKITNKLNEFDIPVKIKEVHVGPSVMQYAMLPESGVKLSKITGLKNDLALALSASHIRVEAPIPGKGLVGVEIPNKKRRTVTLRDLLEAKKFSSMKSKLKIPLGQDVAGNTIIGELDKMPHLLVAGSTGSGKSVGMNTFLISLIYQNSPDELKMILIDPKRVELSTYNNIPYLLTPVIMDADKAVSALRWAVAEMNRRYKILGDAGARNIADYNKKVDEKMPKIVLVIDEFADIMMSKAKKEVEVSICKIAQMARAIGMHMILATQRPSVDVITGLIKANIPARIAYTVSSGIDSRTILGAIGAEGLLGMGDMLFLSGNEPSAKRVQGAFVSSEEIEAVTNYVKTQSAPNYDEDIIVSKDEEQSNIANLEFDDPMCKDALNLIIETNKASASLLQRKLSVGYARAARILDVLEEKGFIGPTNGAKPREIYTDMF